MNWKYGILVTALLISQHSFAGIDWVFPPEANQGNKLLISGAEGEELNRILGAVPAHILVGIDGIITDFRTESGDPQDKRTPFYWIEASETEMGLNVNYQQVFGSRYSVGTTTRGDFFVQSSNISSGTTLAQAIELGLKSQPSRLVNCETKEVGAALGMPGFDYTVCVFRR